MGDHVPLPRRMSDIHLDDTSDVEGKPSARPWRPQEYSERTTFEAPPKSRRQRDNSNRITYAHPRMERSPSPSSRYSTAMDFRELDRTDGRRLAESRRREGSWSESEEVASLRRQLRNRDEECFMQRGWIKDLEREIEELRQQLALQSGQPSDGRPTYIKVHRKHLAIETLEEFRLPWEYDAHNPDYIVIKEYIDESFQNELFDHTRALKKRERALREREERVMMLEERERERQKKYFQDRRERDYPRARLATAGLAGDRKGRRRGSSDAQPGAPEPDGWRPTGAAEQPRDDVERPRPRGGPR